MLTCDCCGKPRDMDGYVFCKWCMETGKAWQGWHWTAGNQLLGGAPLPAVGEWLTHDGELIMCHSGLHFSTGIWASVKYAVGTTLHRVSCKGIAGFENDKGVCRHRRIDASADMSTALLCLYDNMNTRVYGRPSMFMSCAYGSVLLDTVYYHIENCMGWKRDGLEWVRDTMRLYFNALSGENPAAPML